MEPANLDDASAPPAGREESASRVIQLNTLMLLIAVIAVCLGVLREMPGLGILLIVLVIPALARTVVGARRRQAVGHSMSAAEKTLAFVGSLGVVAVIGLAATNAFVATCVPTGRVVGLGAGGLPGIILAFAIGLTVGGIVLYHLARLLWPQRGP